MVCCVGSAAPRCDFFVFQAGSCLVSLAFDRGDIWHAPGVLCAQNAPSGTQDLYST